MSSFSGLLSMRVSLEWLFNMLSTQDLRKILSTVNLLNGPWLDHTLVEGVTLFEHLELNSNELTPNVPGRLEALYHLQGSSVIILPGDK